LSFSRTKTIARSWFVHAIVRKYRRSCPTCRARSTGKPPLDCFPPPIAVSALPRSEVQADTQVHREQNKDATVYVGNIDERFSQANLAELMVQMGPVRGVHMPQDRVSQSHQGYGFVEFDTAGSADYAARVLNGIRIWGKPVRVNKASADKARAVDIGAELFVNNLDPQVDEKILYDTFSQFGQVLRQPNVIRDDNNVSKGYGFISYDSFEASDAARDTMNGQYLLSKAITVEYAYKKDGKGERHGDEAERKLAAEGKKHNIIPEQQVLPPAFHMNGPQGNNSQQQQQAGGGGGYPDSTSAAAPPPPPPLAAGGPPIPPTAGMPPAGYGGPPVGIGAALSAPQGPPGGFGGLGPGSGLPMGMQARGGPPTGFPPPGAPMPMLAGGMGRPGIGPGSSPGAGLGLGLGHGHGHGHSPGHGPGPLPMGLPPAPTGLPARPPPSQTGYKGPVGDFHPGVAPPPPGFRGTPPGALQPGLPGPPPPMFNGTPPPAGFGPMGGPPGGPPPMPGAFPPPGFAGLPPGAPPPGFPPPPTGYVRR
jgi:splicing factor 3B subunit 4